MATALRQKSEAAATAGQFTNQIAAYVASPEVFRTRTYLQTLVRGGATTRKCIIAPTNTSDVIQLNLEERVRPELLNLRVGGQE
jgi:hypothetical protein